MKKIKIAFIISNLQQGGAEKQFLLLIKNLNPSIFEKHLYLYAHHTELFFSELDNLSGVKVIKNRLNSKNSFFKIFEAGFYIRKSINNEKYDIIVSTLFMNNFIVRFFVSRRYKEKIIANIRTSIDLYNMKLIWAEKRQIKGSYLVFNSKTTLNAFKTIISKKHHNRLNLIYNGFNIPNNIKSNINHNFGCLGRMSIEKNILQVVRVYQPNIKLFGNKKLIIQGTKGNQYKLIFNKISSNNIKVLDANPDTNKFYNSISVLILPSFFEGCPNVLFEALLRKKLCIISKGANSDNFIKDGINGFVYDGSDKELLKKMKIVNNIIYTNESTKIIENGYQYAKNNFSIRTMVNKYEKLIKEIYEKNKSSNKSKNYTSL